jgi:hypothetical protein
MKVAVCLSGHFRNYKETYQSFKDNIIMPLSHFGDMDIFIHTWDELNTNSCNAVKLDPLYKNMGIFDENEIKDLYKPKRMIIETFDKIKHIFLLKNFTARLPPYERTWDGEMLFSTPMFYKIQKCNELKKQYEEEDNFIYDVVIRYRPDILMDKPIDLSDFNPQKIYCADFGWDSFMYSSSKNMDFICNIFDELSNVYSSYKESDLGPETTWYFHINKLKLEYIRKHPNIKLNRHHGICFP